MKKRPFVFNLPYLIIMVISIALTGITELAKAKFDFSYMATASYWSNMVLTNASAFLMAVSATLMSADAILRNTTNGQGKNAYELEEVVIKASANIKNDIDIFIVEENKRRKKDAWIQKISMKRNSLVRRFKEKDSLQYTIYLEDRENFNLEKATRKVQRRIKLEELLDDEYIEKNLIFLKVKHKKITRRMIENGQFGQQTENTTLAKSGVVLINGILPKFLLSTAVSMFILSFSYELAKWDLVMIVPICSKLVTLLFNANYGRNFAPNYVRDTTIYNLKTRKEWLTKYIDWRKGREITTQSQIINSEI